MLPVEVPAAFFRQINTLFTKFIWAKKRPRASWSHMTLLKCHGGLAVPDVSTYHQAAHLGRVIDWCRHIQNLNCGLNWNKK